MPKLTLSQLNKELDKALQKKRDNDLASAADLSRKVVLVKGEKGDDGYTPIKGKDYRDGIDANEQRVIDAVFSKIRIPKDGTDGTDGQPGKDGASVDMVQIIRDVLAMIPKPADGRDAVLDIDAISNEVIKRIPLELNIIDVKDKLEALQGEDRLDAKAIKNLPDMVQIKGGRGGSGIAEIIAGTNVTVSKHGNKVTVNAAGASDRKSVV